MSWLTKLLGKASGPFGWLLSFILDYFFNKIINMIKKKEETDKNFAQIEAEEKAKAEQMKNAKTEEEFKDAADDMLDNV